jgi:hypothetical protein
MNRKMHFKKKEPFFEGFLSAFDLFGTYTFTKEDFDDLILQESEIEVKENDLELVARDFWRAFTQYEEEIQSVR